MSNNIFYVTVHVHCMMLWSKKNCEELKKVPNHEILGAKLLSLYKKSKFFQLPKGKGSLPVAPVHFQNTALQ